MDEELLSKKRAAELYKSGKNNESEDGTLPESGLTDEINNREVYTHGIQSSYEYEGQNDYGVHELKKKYQTKSGRNIEFYGIHKNKNYDELFEKLLDHGWEKETCAPGMQSSYNHDENPSAGQCTITSMLAQDYFGGTLRQMHVGAGTHTFNEINGKYLDLTSDQFTCQGIKLDYNSNEVVNRENLNAKEEVFARYQKLKQNVER